MPPLWSICSPAYFARLTVLALTVGLTACGERAGGAQSDHNAGAPAADVESWTARADRPVRRSIRARSSR